MNELIVKYAYKNDCLSIDRNFSFESFYFKSNSSKLILFSWAWNSTTDIVNWSIVMHFVDKETQPTFFNCPMGPSLYYVSKGVGSEKCQHSVLKSVSLKIEPLQLIAIYYNGLIFNGTDVIYADVEWMGGS